MSFIRKSILIFCVVFATQAITSCMFQQSPQLRAARKELYQVQIKRANYNYPANSYEYFVSHNQYPATLNIYKDEQLLAKAPKEKSTYVVICLAQQRGRLYVGGKLAADWPVSTGIPGRETPAGKFSVQEKKESYASNRYGKMYNSEGKCINSDADAFSHAVPEGGKFVGSPMPYWQRLTGDGVGMHIGKVAAGRRLSHGCIRTPGEMARELYRITHIGTRVIVSKEVESEFPVREALTLGEEQNRLERRERELQQKIYDLTQAQNKKQG